VTEFKALTGSDLNVYHDEHYVMVETTMNDRRYVFSFAQKGQAITMHFAAEKMLGVKNACDEFCQWAFEVMPWCRMIFAVIDQGRFAIIQFVKKIQFSYLTENNDHIVYYRTRG